MSPSNRYSTIAAAKYGSDELAAAMARATAGWRKPAARARTVRPFGCDPPSTWPAANPTTTTTAIAITVPFTISAQIACRLVRSSASVASRRTTVPTREAGSSMRSASTGRSARTTMPGDQRQQHDCRYHAGGAQRPHERRPPEKSTYQRDQERDDHDRQQRDHRHQPRRK